MKTTARLIPRSNLFLCATSEHAETAKDQYTEIEVLAIDTGIRGSSKVILPSGWHALVDTAAIVSL